MAEDITNTLDSKDLRRFVDHVDEVAGELAIKAVTNVIQSSRCSVVVLSPQSLESAWYRSIMHWSLQQCLEPSVLFRLVPVYVGGAKSPQILSHIAGLQYSHRHFHTRLIKTVNLKVKRP